MHFKARGRRPAGSDPPPPQSEVTPRREDWVWLEYRATTDGPGSIDGDPVRRLSPAKGAWVHTPDEMLWDKLEQDVSVYLLCLRRTDLTQEDRDVLDLCKAKLELARDCLDRKTTLPFAFWHVIHEVDGLLLLVMPEDMLASRGLEVLDNFQRSVVDRGLRRIWLGDDDHEQKGPLPLAVHRLVPEGTSGTAAPLDTVSGLHCRQILRGALGVVDSQTNLGFWQLSMNVRIQVWSGVVLVALLAGLALLTALAIEPLQLPFGLWELLAYILAGVAGATLANMLSKDRFQVVQGDKSRWFLYYLFLKPLIGGCAALFFFLIEKSGFLLEVTERDSVPSSAFFQINVSDQTQLFLVMVALSIVAGAFADRILSSTMERVLQKMMMSSEKLPTSAGVPKKASATS